MQSCSTWGANKLPRASFQQLRIVVDVTDDFIPLLPTGIQLIIYPIALVSVLNLIPTENECCSSIAIFNDTACLVTVMDIYNIPFVNLPAVLVMQPLNPYARDADMIGHEVSTDEHLIEISAIFRHYRITIFIKLIIWKIPTILVALRHGNNFADLISRADRKSVV